MGFGSTFQFGSTGSHEKENCRAWGQHQEAGGWSPLDEFLMSNLETLKSILSWSSSACRKGFGFWWRSLRCGDTSDSWLCSFHAKGSNKYWKCLIGYRFWSSPLLPWLCVRTHSDAGEHTTSRACWRSSGTGRGWNWVRVWLSARDHECIACFSRLVPCTPVIPPTS